MPCIAEELMMWTYIVRFYFRLGEYGITCHYTMLGWVVQMEGFGTVVGAAVLLKWCFSLLGCFLPTAVPCSQQKSYPPMFEIRVGACVSCAVTMHHCTASGTCWRENALYVKARFVLSVTTLPWLPSSLIRDFQHKSSFWVLPIDQYHNLVLTVTNFCPDCSCYCH